MPQAAFKNIAEEQQHIAGPAHRKALAREQSEQEHKARLARGRDAADSAVVSYYAVCGCCSSAWHSQTLKTPEAQLKQPFLLRRQQHSGLHQQAAPYSLHMQSPGKPDMQQPRIIILCMQYCFLSVKLLNAAVGITKLLDADWKPS